MYFLLYFVIGLCVSCIYAKYEYKNTYFNPWDTRLPEDRLIIDCLILLVIWPIAVVISSLRLIWIKLYESNN